MCLGRVFNPARGVGQSASAASSHTFGMSGFQVFSLSAAGASKEHSNSNERGIAQAESFMPDLRFAIIRRIFGRSESAHGRRLAIRVTRGVSWNHNAFVCLYLISPAIVTYCIIRVPRSDGPAVAGGYLSVNADFFNAASTDR